MSYNFCRYVLLAAVFRLKIFNWSTSIEVNFADAVDVCVAKRKLLISLHRFSAFFAAICLVVGPTGVGSMLTIEDYPFQGVF